MQTIEELMLKRATEMLESGEVDKVIGWKKGQFYYDNSPATFTKGNLDGFVYNAFCGANLSKYLVEECKKGGKILIFLKPCDSYSFNQLVAEHRINREMIYVIAIECQGKLDEKKFEAKKIYGITDIEEDGYKLNIKTIYGEEKAIKAEVYLSKCETCKSKKHAVADEKIILNEMQADPNVRFQEVERLEKMTADERYNFWREELSKCIRCYACRNVCPACTCTHCVFDNNKSGIAAKANDDKFEENLYHIIRSFHVAGRCTDCGECTRVCPQGIPLHLINRKYIKDINENYGVYQAGENVDADSPVVAFQPDDIEAKEVVEGKKS